MSKITGVKTEILFDHHVLELGGCSCRPIGDYAPYDRITDFGGYLRRVQIKTAWWRASKGVWMIGKSRLEKYRGKHGFDIMAVYCFEMGWYLMDWEEFSATNTFLSRGGNGRWDLLIEKGALPE